MDNNLMGARTGKGTKDAPWPDIVRERIRAAKIEDRLRKHLMGEIDLSTTQVAVGLGLLRKILPDLSATELSGEIDNKHRVVSGTPLTDSEWEKRYSDSLEQPAPQITNGNGKAVN